MNSYAIGVIFAFAITACIWLYMFLWHITKSDYSFGGFLIAIGFIAMTYRSYQFFVVEGQVGSEKVMVSLFISAATFLAGSFVIALPMKR